MSNVLRCSWIVRAILAVNDLQRQWHSKVGTKNITIFTLLCRTQPNGLKLSSVDRFPNSLKKYTHLGVHKFYATPIGLITFMWPIPYYAVSKIVNETFHGLFLSRTHDIVLQLPLRII